MSMKHRFAITLLTAVLLAATACGNGAGAGSSTPSGPAPGTVTGTVVSFMSGHRHATKPQSRVSVEAYTRAFPYIGPVVADQPHPVARAVTDGRGRFVLRGLQPGRYFLLFGRAAAKWVRVGQDRGATVTAALCRNCPLPM
jgi:hypothetical protein